MKRNSKLLILLGILVVIGIATLIITHVEKKKEEILTTDQVILEIPTDSVTALSWTTGDTSLSYHKNEEGTWLWDEDDAFPVDQAKIEDLLSDFNSFGAAFIINTPDDLSVYGLTDPVQVITITTQDQTYEVKLGTFSALDSERYVSTGDGNVYLVDKDPYDDYDIEVNDTILDDTIPDFGDQITEVAFEGVENYTITYNAENTVTPCEADCYFTDRNGKTVALDTSLVTTYLSTIEKLGLTTFVTYNATEEELESYGFNDPELKVTVAYQKVDEDGNTKDQSFVLTLGQNQEELTAKAEAEKDGGTYSGTVTTYARVGESQILYTITTTNNTKLTAMTYNDLRHQNVITADLDTATALDVTVEGVTYEIQSETKDGETVFVLKNQAESAKAGTESQEVSDKGTGTESQSADGSQEVDISDILAEVEDMDIVEFRDGQEASEETLGKEEIALTFYFDSESFPQITLTLYRVDGTYCLAEVDGQVLGLVMRSAVVDLMEEVNSIVLG